MGPLTGRLTLADGRVVEWATTFFGVTWAGGTQSMRLPGEPSVFQIEAALIGWHQGEAVGRQTGRAMLQNEFRNLMDCRR